jgi:hypothetical protein
MQDRRQAARSAARFVALALAGLAVAGTSIAVPSVPPQQLTATGSVQLDAGQSIVVQPIDVALESGMLSGLSFRVDLRAPASGVVAMIVATDARAGRAPNGPTNAAAGGIAQFPTSCSTMPCAQHFAIVFTRSGEASDEAIDVAWSLQATATFTSSGSSSPPPGRVTMVAGPAGPPSGLARADAASGATVRLTEPDRFRVWRVTIHREAADGALTGAATTATLTPSATQTAGPAFPGTGPKDRRLAGRTDPPVQVRLIGPGGALSTSWVADGSLQFDPFPGCAPETACDDTIIVELAWADGRPDTAFDAGWTLAVESFAATGSPGALSIQAEELPPPALAAASASGSFEAGSGLPRGKSRLVASLDPAVLDGGGWPLPLVPGRGLATVRVTSIGTTPIPAGTEIIVALDSAQVTSVGGVPSSGISLEPGGEGTFAFEPILHCTVNGTSGCTFDAILSTSVGSPNATDSAGMAVQVDWSIDLEIRVRTGGSVTIAVDPVASPAPSARP